MVTESQPISSRIAGGDSSLLGGVGDLPDSKKGNVWYCYLAEINYKFGNTSLIARFPSFSKSADNIRESADKVQESTNSEYKSADTIHTRCCRTAIFWEFSGTKDLFVPQLLLYICSSCICLFLRIFFVCLSSFVCSHISNL